MTHALASPRVLRPVWLVSLRVTPALYALRVPTIYFVLANVDQLCAFLDRNGGRSYDDVAVADGWVPMEGHVLAAALDCYLTPVCCFTGHLRPDLPPQHDFALIQESDRSFLGVDPLGPPAINRALRGIPVRERTAPRNRVYDSD